MDQPIKATVPAKQSHQIAAMSIAASYTALNTQPAGLSHAEAHHRLQHYGHNRLREVRGKPLLIRLLANFTHLMAWLLWLGGLVGFIAQQPQLGIAIWLVNIINGLFSFWQEYKAERASEALRRLLPSYARVMRNGAELRIPAEELVPGDVMLLNEGDYISADARLVSEAELHVDQATLTGEALPIRKTAETVQHNDSVTIELPNLVFAGTSVAAGNGSALVIHTGMNTEFGTIAHLTQSISEQPSPLQQEMEHVTRQVTLLAVGIGTLFFMLAIALAGVGLAESFLFAMGMIVAFVPEGMLPTVTLALALGTQRMAKRNALVKRLSAVETLGSTTVICTDKTGTLTQNEMTVRALWCASQHYTVNGVGYAPEGQILANKHPLSSLPSDLQCLLRGAGLCNNAHLLPPGTPNADNGQPSERWSILGDPTEAALLVVARKGNIDLAAATQQTPRIHELPFDSQRKRMSTIHQQTEATVIVYVKGAPQEVIAHCQTILVDNQVQRLDLAMRKQIEHANDAYARTGLRVLAVAMRTLAEPADSGPRTIDTVEEDLTFLGLIAMMDPPRPEVSTAVALCHQAGIRIIMITGDYGLTAESIARRIGIIEQHHPRIITGGELNHLDDLALQQALRDEVIFARVAPEHKLRVVKALQSMGQIVAVTGDGVNDAPALKQADIGVAMGITGTDVAKAAADMILTDDNFASIVAAVEEGRAVYANIKKFITYIFTSNTPEAVPFILFVLSGGRIPLAITIMQVLAIDLGTDLVPALALGAEPPEPGLMQRPPRDIKEHVITRPLLVRAFLLLGLGQSLAAMAAFYYQYWTNGYWGQWLDLPSEGPLYLSATAMALAAVVTTQIGNVFTQRSEHTSIFAINLFSNRLLWIAIAVEIGLISMLIYVPFFQNIFGTAAFPPENWLFLLALTPLLVIVDELHKLWQRATRRHPPQAKNRLAQTTSR